MKKSEVIKLIAEVLEEDCQPKFIDITSQKVAQNIFNKLEEVGMQPRRNLITLLNEWDSEE